MNQTTILTNEEIENFIINPLPPPIQFTDRNYNGDFGLLPTEKYEHDKKNLLSEIKWLGEDGVYFKYFYDLYNSKSNGRILHGLLGDYLVEYKCNDKEDYEKLDFVLKILEQKKPRNYNKELVMKYIKNGFELI